jgi:hypothetical protein
MDKFAVTQRSFLVTFDDFPPFEIRCTRFGTDESTDGQTTDPPMTEK